MSKKKQSRREINRQAKVGEIIICPHCGERFVKSTYQQVFCCNECKEGYWNCHKPNRHYDKDYYSQYNMQHTKRLERIGIVSSDVDNMRETSIFESAFPFGSDDSFGMD